MCEKLFKKITECLIPELNSEIPELSIIFYEHSLREFDKILKQPDIVYKK